MLNELPVSGFVTLQGVDWAQILLRYLEDCGWSPYWVVLIYNQSYHHAVFSPWAFFLHTEIYAVLHWSDYLYVLKFTFPICIVFCSLSKYYVTKSQKTDTPSVCLWHHSVGAFNVGTVSGCPDHYPLLWWFHHQLWLGIDCSALCRWVSVFCDIWGAHRLVTENVICCQLVDSCWCFSGS